MPFSMGNRYLVVAWFRFTHYPEARALVKANSGAISRFFMEEIVVRHGVPEAVQIDGGPENRGEFRTLLLGMGIRTVVLLAYNFKANGAIEVGNKPLQNGLAKATDETQKNWPRLLPSMLLADRVTTKSSTGHSPFYLLHGVEAKLPIECEVPTWFAIGWKDGVSKEDLLLARAEQIARREVNMEEALSRNERTREANKTNFDERHVLRRTAIKAGEVVLLHKTIRVGDLSSNHKLDYRWLRPFVVHDVIGDSGAFVLRELHGTVRHGNVHGNRLKRFYARG